MLTKDDQKYLLSSVCYSLQCPMILHSNMLICSSINISDYYQWWKRLCYYFCGNCDTFYFRIL